MKVVAVGLEEGFFPHWTFLAIFTTFMNSPNSKVLIITD